MPKIWLDRCGCRCPEAAPFISGAGVRIVDRTSEAARQMVDVLLLAREHGPAHLELAVRGALTAGAIDGHAVSVLAHSG